MVRLSPPERIGEFFGIYGLVGKASQVIGQALYGAIIFLFLSTLGVVAYQVAILSLIVTMFIGLWLVWPVSDTWAGSGEIHEHPGPEGPHVLSEEDLVAAHEAGHAADGEEPGHSVAPPARLSPDRAPLGDRDAT
jgi:hypothetical protein